MCINIIYMYICIYVYVYVYVYVYITAIGSLVEFYETEYIRNFTFKVLLRIFKYLWKGNAILSTRVANLYEHVFFMKALSTRCDNGVRSQTSRQSTHVHKSGCINESNWSCNKTRRLPNVYIVKVLLKLCRTHVCSSFATEIFTNGKWRSFRPNLQTRCERIAHCHKRKSPNRWQIFIRLRISLSCRTTQLGRRDALAKFSFSYHFEIDVSTENARNLL